MSYRVEKRINELKAAIDGYAPGSTFRLARDRPIELPPVLRIGLFGPTGVVKTALINSMNYATGPMWESRAAEGFATEASKTLARYAFPMTERITMIDNRGMRSLGGPFMVELGHQIDDGLQLFARNAKWSTERQRALIHNTECNEMKNALISWVSLSAWILPLLIVGVMIAPATASTQFLATKSTETLNLIEGTNATIKFDRFDCPSPAVPVYTVRYLTEEQPFCCESHDSQAIINEGLKDQGQESRFSVGGSLLNDTFSVFLNISDVSVQDGGKIELVYFLLNHNDHVFLKRIAEINVVKPPKKAKCHFLREEAFKHHVVQCHAPAENDTMTISCYQALSKTTPIAVYTDSDDMIRATFLAPLDDQVQCCSHLTTENVTQETCDYSFFRHPKQITPPTSSASLPSVTEDQLHNINDLSTEGFRPSSSADQDELSGWMPLYLHVIIVVCTSFSNILM